jgi:hypothetical protein
MSLTWCIAPVRSGSALTVFDEVSETIDAVVREECFR